MRGGWCGREGVGDVHFVRPVVGRGGTDPLMGPWGGGTGSIEGGMVVVDVTCP